MALIKSAAGLTSPSWLLGSSLVMIVRLREISPLARTCWVPDRSSIFSEAVLKSRVKSFSRGALPLFLMKSTLIFFFLLMPFTFYLMKTFKLYNIRGC